MNWLEEEIAHHLNFTSEDLVANQQAHLSSRQTKLLRSRTMNLIVLGILPYLLFLGIFLTMLVSLLDAVPQSPIAIVFMMILGLVSLLAPIYIIQDLWSIHHNSVRFIEGEAKTVLATQDVRARNLRIMTKFAYLLRVIDDSGKKRTFLVANSVESLSKRPRWRIYYSPRFREFLSMEVVEENPEHFAALNFVTESK